MAFAVTGAGDPPRERVRPAVSVREEPEKSGARR